ncbi:MAG TPA: GNAT family N-acetyltransferase [Polyangia bacterium]
MFSEALRREGSAAIAVEAVTDVADLARTAPAWNRLVQRQPRTLPFGTYPWVSAFLQHRLPPGRRWCCLFARRAGELAGVLPLVITPDGRGTTVANTPRDDHTFSVDATMAAGQEPLVLPALLAAAFRMIPGCRRVDLQRLPADSPTLALARASGLGRPAVISLAGLGAYLPIEGDFAEFRTRLSRTFRNNLSKAANKLSKSASVEVSVSTGSQASAKEDLQAFLQVEASSWKGDTGTAILRSTALTAFYTTLVERLAAAGWLEWHVLRAEGRMIAGNLAVTLGTGTVIWKLGYDQDYARMSPGSLLLERVVMHAHERHGGAWGGGEINLVTNYDWYDNWNMRRRRYETLRVYAGGLINNVFRYWPQRLEQAARDTPAVVSAVRRIRARLGKPKGDHGLPLDHPDGASAR